MVGMSDVQTQPAWRGVKQETIDMIRFCGVDFASWLDGFEDTEKSVRGTVKAIVSHPLIPQDVTVTGFIIHSVTGELTKV
jgi:carbonic anhydrase